MVDYSQFVFQERDHSYGYAEEVSVRSVGDYGYPYTEEGELVHQYQLLAAQTGDARPDDGCQDLPLNLSLNFNEKSEAGGNAASWRRAEGGSGPGAPQLGGEFIVCEVGAHIAQEEIVESEALEEEGCEEKVEDEEGVDEEEAGSSDEEGDEEGVYQAFSHEVSRNSRLRSKVNDLTKVC